jgi:type II secretory pathway component PulF
MDTIELDSLMALNDQLLALKEAGVPIGAGVSQFDLAHTLEKINTSIARRTSAGSSLAEALELDPTIPQWYRGLIVSGLRSDNMDSALRDFAHVVDWEDEIRFAGRSAWFYPLIVAGLAYLGLIGFCLFLVPRLVDMYRGFEIQVGSGLKVLQTLRETLPIWVAIPPALLLIYLLWKSKPASHSSSSSNLRSGLLSWLSGASEAMFEQRCAYFANSLASLDEGGTPFEKALGLAAGVCGEASLAEGARSVAGTISNGGAPDDDKTAADRFPPFLHWAVCQTDPAIDRGRALRLAASLYRESSIYSMRRARIIAPIVCLITLGGGVTLMYGLALFVPLVQMLKSVASTH